MARMGHRSKPVHGVEQLPAGLAMKKFQVFGCGSILFAHRSIAIAILHEGIGRV